MALHLHLAPEEDALQDMPLDGDTQAEVAFALDDIFTAASATLEELFVAAANDMEPGSAEQDMSDPYMLPDIAWSTVHYMHAEVVPPTADVVERMQQQQHCYADPTATNSDIIEATDVNGGDSHGHGPRGDKPGPCSCVCHTLDWLDLHCYGHGLRGDKPGLCSCACLDLGWLDLHGYGQGLRGDKPGLCSCVCLAPDVLDLHDYDHGPRGDKPGLCSCVCLDHALLDLLWGECIEVGTPTPTFKDLFIKMYHVCPDMLQDHHDELLSEYLEGAEGDDNSSYPASDSDEGPAATTPLSRAPACNHAVEPSSSLQGQLIRSGPIAAPMQPRPSCSMQFQCGQAASHNYDGFLMADALNAINQQQVLVDAPNDGGDTSSGTNSSYPASDCDYG